MFEEFENTNQKMNLYVEQSIASAFTMSNLINDLLDLAKMETATFTLAIEQFNMFEVIADAY
jgi:signal transduction histidine kinase